jgi:hypothetical protein
MPLPFRRRRQTAPVATPPPQLAPDRLTTHDHSLRLQYHAKSGDGVRLIGEVSPSDLPGLMVGVAASEIELIEPLNPDVQGAAPSIVHPDQALLWINAHYEPIDWEAAFQVIAAELRGLDHPNDSIPWEPAPLSSDPGFERILTGGPGGRNRVQCGLRADGAALCWGWDTPAGILAADDVRDTCADRPCNREPAPVTGNLRFRDLSIGTRSACGVTTEGALYCWGENRSYQLGAGRPDVEATAVPLRVPDPL